MKRMILAFILTSFFIGPALNAAPFIYGLNSGEGAIYHLTIVDIASSSSIYQTIIAPDPTAIQLTPDNHYAYIAFGDSVPYFSTIQVFDTFTQTFSSFTLGTRNLMMAITPDGAYGYTTTDSNHLNAFEIPSNHTHPNIITLPNVTASNGIAISPDQQYVYVTDASSNNVQIVDISSPLSPTIPYVASFSVGTSGTHLAGIAITSDGSTAYVVSSNANEVYQVTGLPSSPTAGIIIPVNGYPGVSGSAIPIVLTGDNETAYVGIKDVSVSSLGSLVIINDLTTSPVTTFIAAPSFITVPALAISQDSKYVAAGTDGLGIIETADNSFVVIGNLLFSAVSITANPNPPTNVQGCALQIPHGDFTNVITWDPPASAPNIPAPYQYNIYSDPALTIPVGSVPATGPLNFQVFGLDPNTTYTYYIVTADQLGDQSTPVAVTITPDEYCNFIILPPSSIEGCFIDNGDGTITNFISWAPPASGQTPVTYEIFYDLYLMEPVTSVPGNVFNYEDSNVSPSNNSYYIVSVDQFFDVSEPIGITITDSCYAILPPNSITGCFIQNDDGSITNFLSWTPPAYGPAPAQYQIFYDVYLTELVATVPGNVFSYEDQELSPGTYTYYIVSVDSAGDMSTPIDVTITDPCYGTVFPPSSIEGCFMQNDDGTVTNVISWTPPAYGPVPVEYQIFYDVYLTYPVATVAGNVFSYEDGPLSPGTYTYYIVSVDQFGDISEPIDITITDPCYPSPYMLQPDPPTNAIGKLRCNIFLDRSERILNICWTASASTDVISYNIYNGSTLVANILATKPLCFVTALGRCDNGQNFSVTAVDNNGVESVHVPVIVV